MCRRIIIPFLAVGFIALGSCDENSKESSNETSKLIERIKVLNREENLGWNISYREALLLKEHPMGRVFSYQILYEGGEVEKESFPGKLKLQVNILAGSEGFDFKKCSLLLDDEIVSLFSFQILRKDEGERAADEVVLIFEASIEDLLDARSVSFSSKGNSDRLIPMKSLFNERIKSYVKSKKPRGILNFLVRF